MNKREVTIIKEIKKDCILLEKKKQLTSFGEGQLCLIKILKAYSFAGSNSSLNSAERSND